VTDTAIADPLADLLAVYPQRDIPMPKIAGQFAGRSVIIVADAACVWDDLEKFGAKITHRRGEVGKPGWDIMTINRMVEYLPGNITHAYSNEAELLLKFIASRRNEYRREFNGPAHTHSISKGAQHRWPWGGCPTCSGSKLSWRTDLW